MKLTSKMTPYSSVVGGGLTLTAEDGSAAFMVMFIGTTKGITKEENQALAEQFHKWISEHGLSVPDRPTTHNREG